MGRKGESYTLDSSMTSENNFREHSLAPSQVCEEEGAKLCRKEEGVVLSSDRFCPVT